MKEIVSIIMPSYNTAKYIQQSIQSVINQTFTSWELIIVDDNSTDDTKKIVENFNDNRIKFIKNETNNGAAYCRNKALKEAKGKWIAFLDSDDIWLPKKLENQLNFMKNKNYFFSYTKYEEIDERSVKTGKIISGPSKISKNGMFRYCWPGCLTVMYNRDVIGLIQIEEIKKNNDYAMWLKICKKYDCFLLDEILGQYRRGRLGSISTQSYFSLIKWHYRLFRVAEKENKLLAAWHTAWNLYWGLWKKIKYVKVIK